MKKKEQDQIKKLAQSLEMSQTLAYCNCCESVYVFNINNLPKDYNPFTFICEGV